MEVVYTLYHVLSCVWVWFASVCGQFKCVGVLWECLCTCVDFEGVNVCVGLCSGVLRLPHAYECLGVVKCVWILLWLI